MAGSDVTPWVHDGAMLQDDAGAQGFQQGERGPVLGLCGPVPVLHTPSTGSDGAIPRNYQAFPKKMVLRSTGNMGEG